jgi:lysophospholipase L1-like esterase
VKFPLLVCSLGLMVLVSPVAHAVDFALRDGDTVVFLGDSITAARTYGKIIEDYALLRYPDRTMHFINAGHGGDTAAGGLARLGRDVFSQKATVLLVAYGINDIGWGGKADAEHRQQYLEALRGIITQCRQRDVRVFICSAAITAQDPAKSENDFLQKMCDDGLALARELDAGAIDVQRGMREIQKRVWAANAATTEEKDKSTLHAADGIHLNDLGQLAMAFAILKGLGAPAEVSSVEIDATGGKVVRAEGCRVDGLKVAADTMEFDRLDAGLPLNLTPLWELNFRFIPIPDELNRYLLATRNLAEGRYELRVNDRPVGTFAAEQLATGVNLASAKADPWVPGGPWDAQAVLVHHLTEARSELALMRSLTPDFLRQNPQQAQIGTLSEDVNQRFEALQKATARPAVYHFSLRRVADSPK